MGIRKVKVVVEDDQGRLYSFTVPSPISREKIAQFIDLVEMMSGPSEREAPALSKTIKDPFRSKFEKILVLIRERFPLKWFTSSEVQLAYEEEFKEPISLSTVSTYLSRYFDRGILLREGPPNMLRYKLNVETLKAGWEH